MNTLKSIFLLLAAMAAVSTSAPAQTDVPEHYLHTAAQNNPGLQAAFLSFEAELQKIPQAGAYQDPQLETGFFPQPMEIVDGRLMAELKLMQMFPWFGTQKAARSEAQHMAAMAFEQFRETRSQLFLDVRTQWFVLCRLQQQLAGMRENKALLLQMEELALRKFASPTLKGQNTGYSPPAQAATEAASATSGKAMADMAATNASTPARMTAQGEMEAGMKGNMAARGGGMSSGMSDVLRIRIEILEAENNIESLLSETEAEKARFNALLNRPPESEVTLPDTLRQMPFLMDQTSAMTEITRLNPMLKMLNEEKAAYKAKALMEKKMSYPMFGIGMQYMLVRKSKTADMAMANGVATNAMNGKDMLMPMISVSIPVLRNKYKAQQRQAALLQEANSRKYDNTLHLIETELRRLKHEMDDAARKIALYSKQSELTQNICKLTVGEFISGKADLTMLIQTQRQLLDCKLKTAEAIAAYNTIAAGIEKLTCP
ncbi:MAG: TolC family protein [Tannerella sp.]|jgi:outer membrane protein TolC|nr:TolC family protein [Tannerella sp.]